MTKSPLDYGLSHTDWRPHQQETIDLLLAKRPTTTTILQAPVGSGKTSLAKAMGVSEHGVTALVKTKLLQESNYLHGYSFDILFGRSNYDCPHPEQPETFATAAECLYENDMPDCDIASDCPFLTQKSKVLASKTRSLNYSLYLMSRWTRDRRFATDYLFCDEAHMLSDEVVEFVGLTIRDIDRIKHGLPEFPTCYQSSKENAEKVLSWLEEAIGIVDTLADTMTDKGKLSKLKRLSAKLSITYDSMSFNLTDWYVRSGQRALEFNGQPRPGLVVKPLTARYHFPKLFLGVYPKVVLMSATIGDPQTFAEELGIERYEYDAIPNQFSPERRPVHVPKDCPTLGYKSPESAWLKQAQYIKGYLDSVPDDWLGVLHVNSYKQASELARRLSSLGFNDRRLFVPQSGGGTNKQMQDWQRFKSSRKGALIITPSFSEGVDLTEERICIVAKTPFPATPPGSYEAERMAYSGKFYKQRTAWRVEQSCGRTRRGRDMDYDNGLEKRGLVAIVDGAYVRMGVRSQSSKDFVESLVYD